MTTIDPSNQVALAMQAQLAALRERDRAKAKPGAAASPSQHSRVSNTVAQRIQTIAPEDPDRRRKAVRIFLQAELLREFGDGLLNDPQFGTMLDAVQEEMAQDETMAAAASALGDLLLSRKATG